MKTETLTSREFDTTIARVKTLCDLTCESTGASLSLTWKSDNLGIVSEKTRLYDPNKANRNDKAMKALCALLTTQSFNGKDGLKIGSTFDDFYRSLPTDEDDALFDVVIPDDATILLTYSEYIFEGQKSKIDKEALTQIVEEYGSSVKADEISVDCEDVEGFCPIKEWRIRLWWD